MSLPKISHAIYNDSLPSTGKKVSYRSFLGKEEKILLMAKESKETADIYNAIKQIITNCVVTKGFNVNKIATFDMEYLFLKLFSKSINNIIAMSIKDPEDDKEYEFKIDLDKITIVRDPDHSKNVLITDDIGVVMRYPTVDIVDHISSTDTLAIEMIRHCIEKIYTKDEVFDFHADHTTEEQDEFLDDMPVAAYESMKKFFESSPHMYYEIKYKNSLGTEKKISLRSIEDFFSFRSLTDR
jgi:hypothetical protein